MADEKIEYTNPEFIHHKIDWEGWPDALEWLVNCSFEDEELDQLIYDAAQQYGILEGYHHQIESKLDEMGVEAP